jgi:protein transport protein SEC61 subunit gamma and related proteins
MSNQQETPKPSLGSKLKSFAIQSKRVWQVLKKPTSQEFKTVSKVSAIGILILGAIGFVIADIIRLIGNIF